MTSSHDYWAFRNRLVDPVSSGRWQGGGPAYRSDGRQGTANATSGLTRQALSMVEVMNRRKAPIIKTGLSLTLLYAGEIPATRHKNFRLWFQTLHCWCRLSIAHRADRNLNQRRKPTVALVITTGQITFASHRPAMSRSNSPKQAHCMRYVLQSLAFNQICRIDTT